MKLSHGSPGGAPTYRFSTRVRGSAKELDATLTRSTIDRSLPPRSTGSARVIREPKRRPSRDSAASTVAVISASSWRVGGSAAMSTLIASDPTRAATDPASDAADGNHVDRFSTNVAGYAAGTAAGSARRSGVD